MTMDEREQYIAAMDDLRVDKNLGANIAKMVANEAAAEAEEMKKYCRFCKKHTVHRETK